ncbi:MAG: 3-hydroxyacyl-CoA dehydrogenase family protein [Deltaproteobacteria bacterium]|nr:3-hydroxyacyl-CoA dehydrogenase family protein [Deltaproteobacteria bacterium]
MTIRGINKIGVIGAGTMGRGIAQVFAMHGYYVALVDRDDNMLKAAVEGIREHTDPALWPKVADLIETGTRMEAAADCDIVVEAVYEDVTAKKGIFKALGSICRPSAIIASNTSSISIGELSAFVPDPTRFIGMHFMNPPKVMKLIEIIKGSKTAGRTVRAVVDLARDIGKEPAVVNDSPGFVSNRLLFALIGEAIRLHEAGVAAKEDIDSVMKYGMNHPMGPLELADFIGLDVCKNIMEYLHGQLDDDKYAPPPSLLSLVKAGRLGRKAGEGFYKYDHGERVKKAV